MTTEGHKNCSAIFLYTTLDSHLTEGSHLTSNFREAPSENKYAVRKPEQPFSSLKMPFLKVTNEPAMGLLNPSYEDPLLPFPSWRESDLWLGRVMTKL